MIGRSSQAIVFLLIFSACILAMANSNAQAKGFDMFSFFTKKGKAMPSIVHPYLGAQLTKLTDYLSKPAPLDRNMGHCIKAKTQGALLIPQSEEDGYIEPSQSSFIWTSMAPPLAFINNQEQARFDVWELDSVNALKPVKKLSTNMLDAQMGKWINYSVVDAACLPAQRLLLAVNYYDPRSKTALYLYDAPNQQFSVFSNADAHAQNLGRYFEQKDLNSGETLITYYSDTQRKSAEIYHNYYNNIVLFSDKYPQGIEILKLSIDDGNIKDWNVIDKKLVLHAIDNRDHNNPKPYFWSLDLSKILAN